MKTRTLSIVAFVAVAFTAGWNYQQNKQNVELPELVLENIDTLANGEESGEEDFCWSQFSGGLACVHDNVLVANVCHLQQE